MDQARFQHVDLTAAAGPVEAAHGQADGAGVPGLAVVGHRAGFEAGQANAADAAGHAGEELGGQRAAEAHGLEVVAAAVGGDHRDAHLRQDLQQARLDGGLVVDADLAEREVAGEAAFEAVLQALLGEIGVDRGGADADQYGEAVGVETLGRADDDRDVAAQALGHQVGVDAAGGQDHRQGDAVRVAGLVGEHDGAAAAQGGVLRLGPHPLEVGAQAVPGAGFPGGHGEGAVDHGERLVAHEGGHPLVHAGGQHRAFQHIDVGLGLVLGQDVAEVLEPGLQAHHRRFAQAVNRRVGDLAEVLAEEVAERAVAVGQHRQRRVVAHRADGLLGLLDHRGEDQLHVFQRHAGGGLAAGQFLAGVLAGFGTGADHRFQFDHVGQPVGVGLGGGQGVDDVLFAVETAFGQVDGDHPAGGDVGLFGDAAVGQAEHAGLRAQGHQAVIGVGHAHRAQAVAVLAGHHPAAIGGADGGGAVPRLHHRVAVGIEGAVRGLHLGVALGGPGFGDQQGLDHRRVAAGADQHLEGVVEVRGVRAAGLDHRLDVVAELAERLGGHADLVALHPVLIALAGVDLAVVGQHAERLGQAPLGEGVGGVALVEDGHGGGEALVAQVGVELVDVLGQEHALVDQRASRQRADVEAGQRRLDHAPFDPLAAQEQRPLQRLAFEAGRRGEHDLLDLRARGVGLVADNGGVHRDLAPAVEVEAEAQRLGFDDGSGGLLGGQVGAWQEDLADSDRARAQGVADAADLLGEEVLRHRNQHAGPVAGLAVGVDGPAVPDRLQRLDRQLDHLAARLAVDRADQTDAAGVVLLRRIVGVAVDQLGAVRFIPRCFLFPALPRECGGPGFF